ncbi:MAG: hypothetical protein L3J79_11925 [Candidatus Marinimicrobia bacterium]|nr:hypothetical protein [Candidatus Neomarinimicrobiota bacterium]
MITVENSLVFDGASHVQDDNKNSSNQDKPSEQRGGGRVSGTCPLPLKLIYSFTKIKAMGNRPWPFYLQPESADYSGLQV